MAKRDVIEIPIGIVYVDGDGKQQPRTIEPMDDALWADVLRKRAELKRLERETAEDSAAAKPVLMGLVVLPVVPVKAEGTLSREEMAEVFRESLSKIK